MKKRTVTKRLFSLFVCITLLLELFPASVFAADNANQKSLGGVTSMEEATVSVEYPGADRTSAKIVYHKKGVSATPFNLIFLVDISKEGAKSHKAFEQVMRDNGMGYIYDYGANSSTRIISYQNTVMQDTGWQSTKTDLTAKLGQYGVAGEGTANEETALKETVKAVQEAHGNNGNPTVVFWVLGDSFGQKDAGKIDGQLQKLTKSLNQKDALITWQLADQPNDMLTNYATEHGIAHSTARVHAAYAEKDAVIFRQKMSESLEQIVLDHYHNIDFTLKLADGQTLVKAIQDGYCEASSTGISMTAGLTADKKGIDIHLDRVCRQVDLDFILDVDLDPNVYEKQMVIQGGTIVADDSGSNGGLHVGLFDENIAYGLQLKMPSVELDRTAHTITFQTGDASTSPEPIQKLVGQTVTLPMGEGMMKPGSSFGGWNVTGGANYGRHYAPGEILTMPDGDMILKPTFGHVEVNLEIAYEKGEKPVIGNQMMTCFPSNPLDFSNAEINGIPIGINAVKTVTVIDSLLDYDTIADPKDSLHVQLNDVPQAVYARHVGASEADKVVAYLIPSSEGSGSYDMVIAGPRGVKAPQDCSNLLAGLTNGKATWSRHIQAISLEKLDTSSVTNMGAMFNGCASLKSLALGKFDTSSVTNMNSMFNQCSNLISLDVSKFDTSQVVNIGSMFNQCSNLISLDVSKFDTSQVTYMYSMFNQCSSLSSLDLRSFETSQVTNMSQMFRECKNLSSLDLGTKFDTSKVTDMSSMFNGCSKLLSLNVSDFNTSKVTNMALMFRGCSSLSSLNLGTEFDTSSVTNMYSMFNQCSSLRSLNLGTKFDTSRVIRIEEMFNGCSSLTDVDVSSFDTSMVADMSSMFNQCSSLTNLNLGSFDTSQVKDMSSMFNQCSSLNSLNLGSFDTSQVTNMSSMFNQCTALGSLSLSSFDTSQVTNMGAMFNQCSSLTNLILGPHFDVSHVMNLDSVFADCSSLVGVTDAIKWGEKNAATTVSKMFINCRNLKSIVFETPASGAQFDNLAAMKDMFSGCHALTSVNLSNWILPNLTNTSSMFNGCTSLKQADLSWRGIRSPAENFNTTDMFTSVPNTATLTIGTDNTENTQAVMAKIAAAFPNQSGIVSLVSTNSLNKLPQSKLETEEFPETTSPDLSALSENGTEQPSSEQHRTEQSSGSNEENSPDPKPQEPGAKSASVPTDLSMGRNQNIGIAVQLPIGLTGNNTAGNSLDIYPTEVEAGDTITYKVTVKYVGDVGVKSGRIDMNLPIPDKIKKFSGNAQQAAGWHVSTTEIDYTSAPTGYKGGRVVVEPYIDDTEPGKPVLRGALSGLYTGTQITVSIQTTVEAKPNTEYNGDGYAFWDGTAYARDAAGSAASQTVRLWNKKGTDPAPTPTPDTHSLRYAFTGDVPSDAVLPATEQVKPGSHPTASQPNTSLPGYHFEGWYRSDTNQRVTPGQSVAMPNADLTLTGNWTLAESAIQKIKVQYAYDNGEGKHVPEGAPALPGTAIDGNTSEQIVKVGATHYIQRISQDADHHKFSGWVPKLSVAGKGVPLILQPDGSYQDAGNGYRIDVEGGTLETEQFRNQQQVIVRFEGSWIPYQGTLHFDANGGEGVMADLKNVTWDDVTTKLTKNTFTYPDAAYRFVGWAKTPSGGVVKQDEDVVDHLIDRDGETVTLYAVWKRATYGIGYDLIHVTSSNTANSVSLGGSYETTLTQDAGYERESVSITMGNVEITSSAYDPTTGKVAIPKVTGDLVIRATAGLPNHHTITVSVTGGTAIPNGRVSVEDGRDQTITFTPESGSVLKRVTVDGNPSSLTGSSYTFSHVTEDHTIAVVFEGSGGDGGDSHRPSRPNKDPIDLADPELTGVASLLNCKEHRAYLQGYDTGLFQPGSPITRAEVALYNLLLDPSTDSAREFPDVATSAWYHRAVGTLEGEGILKGYEDGTFRPDQPITRAEFAVIATRFAKTNTKQEVLFPDIPADAWYRKGVQTAVSDGWINGYEDGTFRPNQPITRAETAVIINHMLARIPDRSAIHGGAGTRFPDVAISYWAFDDITEASTQHDYTRSSNTAEEIWNM